MSHGAARPAKHGPWPFDHYLATHNTVMGHYRASGFIDRDTISFVPAGDIILVQGEIACKGCIVIGVTKTLEYVAPDDDHVQTTHYAYNVSVRGVTNVLRYDNEHPGPMAGHPDAHHKHVFVWKAGDEEDVAGSPFWIGADGWPTLGEVIHEARIWHAENYARLPNPEGFAAELHTVMRR